MESKEAILKMEDPIRSSSFLDNMLGSNNDSTFTGSIDYGDESEKGSLGFMELLGMPQDFGFSDFDMSQIAAAAASLPSVVQTEKKTQTSTVGESAVVENNNNTPTTPNCSSISSESIGAANEEQSKTVEDGDDGDDDDEEEQQHKTKKQLKPKKTSQKRQRQPRFAFMTKSDVDHLEDGYRWRKYGQKAVKNSPFPRSYYRCTSASCNVKKRVERSLNDPSIVVTTYEGQHTHPSPMMPRPSPAAGLHPPAAVHGGFSSNTAAANPFAALSMQQMAALTHQPQFMMNFNYNTNCSTEIPIAEFQARRFCSPHSSALLTDHGLLQDILPSIVRKEG